MRLEQLLQASDMGRRHPSLASGTGSRIVVIVVVEDERWYKVVDHAIE